MLHIVLYQPEIPPNTGNVIRLCANTGACLHIIEPMAFAWDDKRLRRAGLDYHEFASVKRYSSWDQYLDKRPTGRLIAFTTHATRTLGESAFHEGDSLLFGSESRGLPESIRDALPENCRVRLPMQAASRSLNLSNAVAIGLYEAWRQLGYQPLRTPPAGAPD